MFIHETVLKEEALLGLDIKSTGTYVDCTLGGAGHSAKIAEQLASTGRLIGVDQDNAAIAAAEERLAQFDCQTILIKGNFAELSALLAEQNISKVDGVLFDLGVSSPQFDQAERGFSYHQDAPLDMRMDQEQVFTAYHVVNEWPESSLVDILFKYGEESFAKKIAKAIILRREQAPIDTTLQLVDIIKEALPEFAKRKNSHPARRTFQAIRIAVNDELNCLSKGLEAALDSLVPGGRLSVITFHQLEDRICKQLFKKYALTCTCPVDFPVCICDTKPILRLITNKPIMPTLEEVTRNKRSRTAKLRIVEKR